MKKYLKKISDYSIVGGLGATLILFSGCSGENSASSNEQQPANNTFTQASQKEGAFVIIQETAKEQYQIIDEYPSSETRIVLKQLDGTEKILTQEEIDALVKSEEKKIDEGTSNLTNPTEEVSSGGMGLAETLLASAAGAMIGAYIGNKLFNNQNYQNQRANSYRDKSTFSRSVNTFKNSNSGSFTKNTNTATKTTNTATKKSGFFSGTKTTNKTSVGG